MISKCYTAHLAGLAAEIITVEVDISHGLNALSIVGLGDRAVEESKDRVSAAIKNSGFTSPKQKNQKVVISLAPADVRKEGPSFDLAIAVAYLSATRDLACDLEHILILGELSLEGNVRRVSGVLPIACQAAKLGYKKLYIPAENAREASLAENIAIYSVTSLSELIGILSGTRTANPISVNRVYSAPPEYDRGLDMSSVRGNAETKHALEVAAAGMHNVFMYGPPGTGKTMLAHSFRTLLPALTREESVEVTGIYSAAGALKHDFISIPPFRAPHHTTSHSAIVGGGGVFPRPGEVTLAHRGILFLDEFTEFDRDVLEALRQPLEQRCITISRSKGSVTFPAHCILIAAMNPCPCGRRQIGGCTCNQGELKSCDRKMSGPILDRIDMWLNVRKIDYAQLSDRGYKAESSASMRARVMRARSIQADRFARRGSTKRFNSEMDPEDIARCVVMSKVARETLRKTAEEQGLSARAFHRAIKVAQTIVDLKGAPYIKRADMLEALHYRQNYEWTTDRMPDRQSDSEHHESRSEREDR